MLLLLLCIDFLALLVSSHTIITYPGWRGDNLLTNGTIGVDDYGDHTFPYGMQWAYPCTLPILCGKSENHAMKMTS